MTKTLIFAAFILSAQAHAADFGIVLHGLSYHTHPRQSGLPWNPTNAGIALRFERDGNLSWQVGGYRDSVFKLTLYGLADYTPWHVGNLALGGFVGAKQSTSTPLTPIAGLVVRYGFDSVALAARIAPAPQSRGAVFTSELVVKF